MVCLMIAVKVPEGNDPAQYLSTIIKEKGLNGGKIVGIGGFKWAKVGIYNGKTYDVQLIMAREGHVLEVASLIGNYLLLPDGEASIHIHVTLGRDHGEVYAGHLVKAEVTPFLEVFLEESSNNPAEVFKHRVKK